MMFWEKKAANAFGIFKSKCGGESSLTTGLLSDGPPEIQLSTFGRVPPSPGSESPSELLNGESLNAEPIADLDLFFQRLYKYYCEKGLWCIIIKWIVELLTIGFTICFSGFFLLFVDWNGLRNAKCGMDAFESGTKPCNLAKEALHQHPLTPLTLSKAIIVGYLGLFSICWVFCFLQFFVDLKDTLGIRHFYYNNLRLTDNEIQTMPWAKILEKVVQLQSSQRLCVVKDLSAHDMVMRLMRKENYLIGMINKGVLAFPISPWVPGVGPTVKFGPDGTRYRLTLTETLEWILNWSILQSMFDRNFLVSKDFVSKPRELKKRFIFVGLAMLLLSPFLVIFMLVYQFLKHAEKFYKDPSTASSRRWSNLSKWMFREFNEVDHLFKHRINSSVLHASDYLKQFPSPIISIIAKFISFVSGGFAAILIIIAFLEESLLEGHIFGRNLFWYAAVFGTITAISRAAVTDELLVLDPEGAMSMVVQHTHYMPKRWRGKENTEIVRIEFETLFQYTGMMVLEVMASIFVTPFLLLFAFPKRVDDILQFIKDFTVYVEGVGDVCSFSTFDFQKHGNVNYGSPSYDSPEEQSDDARRAQSDDARRAQSDDARRAQSDDARRAQSDDARRAQRSSQGKMEKSFLSFQSSYPSWEPDAQGKQFLSNIRTFMEQKLQVQGARHAYSQGRLWQGSPLRTYGDRNGLLSRDVPQNIPSTGYNLGSLWLIDADQKNHPYLLDWYYTSRPRDETSNRRDTVTRPSEPTQQQDGEIWVPINTTRNEAIDEEYWSQHHDDRLQSNLEASTSAPIFHESVLQHHDMNDLGHHTAWWARTGSHGAQPQTSFLEPPDFNRYSLDHHHDNLSERSMEDPDQFLDYRDSRSQWLSRTTYMDDLEAGGGNVTLHFEDIYTRPPETPTVKLRPPSFY